MRMKMNITFPILNCSVKGSLRDRELVTFNQALMGKWLWCFGLEEVQLWRCVVAVESAVIGA